MRRAKQRGLKPLTPWEEWEAQRVRLEQTIAKLESAAFADNEKWQTKMVAHYKGKLQQLLANEPKRHDFVTPVLRAIGIPVDEPGDD